MAPRKRKPAPGNLGAFEAWAAALPVQSERVRTLIELGRSLASAVDRDTIASCSECKRSGAAAALWAEYRRTLDQLAQVIEGDVEDGNEIVKRRLSAVGNT